MLFAIYFVHPGGVHPVGVHPGEDPLGVSNQQKICCKKYIEKNISQNILYEKHIMRMYNGTLMVE